MPERFYLTATKVTAEDLADEHFRILVEGSAIDPGIVAERGIRTIRAGRELPQEYSWRQRQLGSGMLFELHRPDGTTATIFRPDKLDPAKPKAKYRQPPKKRRGMKRGGPGNVVDVHPRMQHLIADTSVPALLTEGCKKGDAITSAALREGIELLPISISGVWNWKSDGEPIEDLYQIPVEDRRTYIGFDSDQMRKPEVMAAAEELAKHLQSRRADVWIIYLEDQPDGKKTGCDDYLAGGRTLEEMLELARPYSPEGFERVKLSRSERLRYALDFLTQRESELPSRTMRDCSKRAAFRAHLITARKHGKLVEDGIEVRGLSARTGAELAGISQPTFSKCSAALEADGILRRGEREKSEQATPYVLLVPPPSPGGVTRYQYERRAAQQNEKKQTDSNDQSRSPHGDNAIPPLQQTPEMRWSSPGRKPRRGLIAGTRRVRQGNSLTDEIPSIRRLGKKRQEIVRYLVESGGSATRKELLESFGGAKTTWRDFKGQTLADLLGRRRRYRGVALSVGPPIIERTDSGVRLVEDWRGALEEHRMLGEEEDATVRQKIEHLRQRAAYRQRGEAPADRAPSEEEMAAGREEREKRRTVARCVSEGMAMRFAAKEVLDADGFIEDLEPATDQDLPPEDPPSERERKMPQKKGGVYVHGALCGCWICGDGGVRIVGSKATPPAPKER